MPNPALALALLGGGGLLAWAGLSDPPGGLTGALSRVFQGQPAGGHSLAQGDATAAAAAQVPKGTSKALVGPLNLLGGSVWPVASHTITEGYHVPNSRYAAGYHTGLDIGAPEGSPVRAPVSGKVVAAGPDGAYGNCVQIRSGKYLVLLAHLSAVHVHPGQAVTAGDLVGNVGHTGNATGPHLHVEVRTAPFTYGHDVNPYKVLP